MRFLSLALPALAANLAAALPSPQDIDLDMVIAAPEPSYTEVAGATAQTVTYDTIAAVAQATASISSISIDISKVASETSIAAHKVKRAACAIQPSGATSVPRYTPDTAAQFKKENYFASVASAAPVPTGYTKAFTNMQASSSAYGYMGFDTLDTYDVEVCASRCSNKKKGCLAFNLYFERDPSVEPAQGCENPSSNTLIKCVYWGGPVSEANTKNNGQWRAKFEVVMAGSNGYVSNQLVTPPGYQQPIALGNNAINAPYDAQGYDTFMGSKIFTQTAWSADLCAKYCDSQTEYNVKHPAKDGTPPKICKFFNTYILTSYSKDGTVTPQGQYCSLYTESWSSKYATNSGQWRGTDQYLVSYSFAYTKAPSSTDVDPTVGDAKGAAYQALADIKWSSLQPFCSTVLGYTTPVVSVTALATTTPVVTQYVALHSKRTVTTPNGLSKYKEAVISSACNLAITSSTITFTTTVATSTVTAPTATATVALDVGSLACNPSPDTAYSGAYNKGGCLNGCYCNVAADGGAFCVDDKASINSCKTNADCPAGEFCDASIGYKCDSGKTCASKYALGKRSLFGLMAGPRTGRMALKARDVKLVVGPNAVAAVALIRAGVLPAISAFANVTVSSP